MQRWLVTAAIALLLCTGFTVSASASSVSHPEKYSTYIKEEGIDVSAWNGIINWFAVKNAGMDFVFLRAGGVFYNSGVFYEDETFERNLLGAQTAGIDTGIYFYSQAISEEEAVKEAEYVLDILDGRKLQMPIVFDFEYAGNGREGRLYNAHLSARKQTDICMAFCRTIEEAGYDAMVYGNAYMLWHRLYGNELKDAYGVWLAEYHWNGATAKYLGEYDIWQYTQYGTAAGISGYTDLNYRYIKPVLEIKEEWNRRMMLKWNEDRSCDGYHVFRKTPDEEAYTYLGRNNDSSITSWIDRDVRRGDMYIYKVVPYVVGEDGLRYEKKTIYGPLETEVSRAYWTNLEFIR